MKFFIQTTNLLLLALVCLLFSCGDNEDRTEDGIIGENRLPRLQIRLTDSPGDYEKVLIDLADVEISLGDGDFEQLDTDYPAVYNLLELTNGVDTLIAETVVEPAVVKEVRLILGPGNNVQINGDLLPLQTPSAQQSGLTVELNEEVPLLLNRTYALTVDFDAGRSVVEVGNTGAYNLNPVLRGSIVDVDNPVVSAGLIGTLNPAARHFVQVVLPGVDTLATYSDALGNFTFNGLTPGTHTLTVEAPPGAPYRDYRTENVEIREEATTDLNVINLR